MAGLLALAGLLAVSNILTMAGQCDTAVICSETTAVIFLCVKS